MILMKGHSILNILTEQQAASPTKQSPSKQIVKPKKNFKEMTGSQYTAYCQQHGL